jgi:hypothetical protein
MAAGPSGAALLPPSWLARRSLPILDLPAGARVSRIHQLGHSAIFFGPRVDPATGERTPPTYRFDSASGGFGVLYAAARFEGAFVETILRNPQLTFVAQNYIRLRCVTELTLSRDLRLVDMRGRGLSRIGTTNAISTGPYAPCWTWSDYLYFHRDMPDGIAYASRHNPVELCYAIFERTDLSVTRNEPIYLWEILAEIRRILGDYHKILTRS